MPPEWSYPLAALEIEDRCAIELHAQASEYDLIARRAGVVHLHALGARTLITYEKTGGRYHVTGQLTARLDVQCVRTGKIFTQDMTADVEGHYANKTETISFVQAKKKRDEEFGDEPNFLDEAEDPEPLEAGGIIDLGELVVQNFILALDPYPLAPDAPPAVIAQDGDAVAVENPFAILAQLREFMDDK